MEARLTVEATARGVIAIVVKVPRGHRGEGIRLLRDIMPALEQLNLGLAGHPASRSVGSPDWRPARADTSVQREE
jgi:hypothetical protein